MYVVLIIMIMERGDMGNQNCMKPISSQSTLTHTMMIIIKIVVTIMMKVIMIMEMMTGDE